MEVEAPTGFIKIVQTGFTRRLYYVHDSITYSLPYSFSVFYRQMDYSISLVVDAIVKYRGQLHHDRFVQQYLNSEVTDAHFDFTYNGVLLKGVLNGLSAKLVAYDRKVGGIPDDKLGSTRPNVYNYQEEQSALIETAVPDLKLYYDNSGYAYRVYDIIKDTNDEPIIHIHLRDGSVCPLVAKTHLFKGTWEVEPFSRFRVWFPADEGAYLTTVLLDEVYGKFDEFAEIIAGYKYCLPMKGFKYKTDGVWILVNEVNEKERTFVGELIDFSLEKDTLARLK